MKKFLQKIFKIVTYFLFKKIHGKIEQSIECDSDHRIEVKIINIEKSLKYKVYKITNGRLYTDRIHDTAIILDNKIIEGPSFQFRYNGLQIYNSKIRDNIVFNKGTPRFLKRLNGTILSLLTGGGGNNNYWHWIFDVLPRLALCSKDVDLKTIDYFLLPNLLKKFQNETLDCLNISKNKRLSSEKFRHIKAKQLILTDHPVVLTGDPSSDIQNIPDWIISWLRSNFLSQNITTKKKSKKKIYIDRDDSKYKGERLISNENEVKEYLFNNNFVSINLGNTHFTDQVDLFYNADCIVGLHGAGFANTVFCQPRTKIVELRSFSAGPVIENLAKKNNLNYHSIITEAKQSHKYNYPNQQGSIQIPIPSLNKILENY
tara:strand:- start:168 stop:1286 length:1119 start_codon:yes stop_codon:yes gene_type:complete